MRRSPMNTGWVLILGKDATGELVTAEGIVPPNMIRRFLRRLLLGEKWVRF